MNDFLNFIEATKAKRTCDFYTHHLNIILSYFEDNKLDFNSSSLTKFVLYQKGKGLNENTIGYRIMCLKIYLEFKNIESDIKNFPILKNDDFCPDFLNPIEIKELIDYVQSSSISLENKLIVFLVLETGVRLNELKNIKCCNIDLDNRKILHEVTKTKKKRTVFFSDLSFNILKKYDLSNDFLINKTCSGIQKVFFRLRDKLGYDKLSPHLLRHTYSTLLIRNGASILLVNKTLGHSSIKTTMRYIHIMDDEFKKEYDQYFKI